MDGVYKELKDHGIEGVECPDEIPENVYSWYANFEPDPEIKTVIAGIDFNFNYRKLCKASLYI